MLEARAREFERGSSAWSEAEVMADFTRTELEALLGEVEGLESERAEFSGEVPYVVRLHEVIAILKRRMS